ncbi:MAG TPA: phosphatidylserine decarboxylase [Burkholderiales bacterium]|nr:phosphatidylserine decarboxylase [Burkholderiales bacterium]
MREPHPIIAREGWPHVLIVLGLAVLATWLVGWWSLVLWALLVFVLQFFRDPSRSIRTGGSFVLSPADGRVVFVGRAQDPYLTREALKISVFMNVFNVHSNRSPVTGEVRKAWYNAGSFLNAALDKASVENERMALHIRTDSGVDVTCVQIAGLIARRIFCYVKEGEHLTAGQRYGYIRFGSRVDVYLPLSAVPKVTIGDRSIAGITPLAELLA